MSKFKIAEMREVLMQAPVDLLKQEIQRRKKLELARKHLPSAEASLQRAQAKVEQYLRAIKEDKGRTTHE